ncbi:MAG: hypothetical protein M3R59_08410 [Verrucomicrobiota bacterium]|nr:hypothetical protein [Verrucomicrobiota bacterium]
MIPALFLVLSVVAYRVAAGLLIHSGSATWLSNFAPLAAIALCSAAYLPRAYKFTLPLIALFVSDVILNVTYGAPLFTSLILCRYVVLALIGWLGYALRQHASLKTMLPASVIASSIFYLVTNAFSWLTEPGYVKNFAGLIQSLTVGLPEFGSTPTWMFFRNSLVSDLIFTALFVLCARAALPRGSERIAPVRAT